MSKQSRPGSVQQAVLSLHSAPSTVLGIVIQSKVETTTGFEVAPSVWMPESYLFHFLPHSE